MKISSLYSNYSVNIGQKESLKASRFETFDDFLRTSFKGQKNFNQKFTPFKSDIINYILKTPEISLDGISQIVQKYSPTTKFVLMDSKNNELPSHYSAFAEHPIDFFTDGKTITAQDNPQVVHFNMPQDINPNTRIKLLGEIIHETTHVFQEESTDRTSSLKQYNKFFNSAKNYDVAINTLQSQIFTTGFFTIEKILLSALASAYDCDFSEPQAIEDASVKDMNTRFKNSTEDTTEEFISQIINFIIELTQTKHGKLDRKAILEMYALRASKEKEAYKNESDIIKKATGINCPINYDLRVTLYSLLEQTAKKMLIS